MLLCVSVMLVILNTAGQVSRRGGHLSFRATTTPLCANQSENIPAWLHVPRTLSLSVSVYFGVCRLWFGVHTEGKSSPSWQRWNGIHGWMKPHKISPSINNHDWFQGHKLLQPRVWKSGATHAKWPGIYQQFLKMPFLYFQKIKR